MLRTSDILRSLVDGDDGERISFGDIVARLDGRAFGICLIIFAAPNCLPMPPGISTVSGAALFLVGAQLALARRSMWVPVTLSVRTVAVADLHRIIGMLTRWLSWLERIARPRYEAMTGLLARRIIGGLVLVLAVIVALPIPIIGNLPPSIAMIVIGLGLIERDGAIVALGTMLGTVLAVAIPVVLFVLGKAAVGYLPAWMWPF